MEAWRRELYCNVCFTEDSLFHHGILGQKWGKRNGPPYPLSPERHSKSEIRAGWQKSIKSIDTTTKGWNNYVKTLDFKNQQVDAARNMQNTVTEVESRITSDNRKIFAEPARVIRDFERDLGKNPYQTEPEDFNVAVKKVNPGYGETGTTNNCVRTGIAMELRNKGYDVVAARSHHGASIFEADTWFDGAKTKGYSSSSDMMKDILRNGEGSSGILSGYFGKGLGSGDGGHTLHWSVKDRHVQIEDGQNGKMFNSFSDAWNHYGFDNGACFSTRLDNTTPNWDSMIEDSVFGVNEGRYWKQNGKIYGRF